MTDAKIETWSQDSRVKGFRIVEFERVSRRKLKWLREIGGKEGPQFVYGEAELIRSGWSRIDD